MMRDFCSGLTRAKTVVCGNRRQQRGDRRDASISAPVTHLLDREAEVTADLGGDRAVVAGDDLDRDAEVRELRDRGAGVGLGAVDERQEALEVEVALVRDAELRQAGRRARGDGEDACAVVEQALQDAPALVAGRRRSARGRPRARPW